MDLVRILITILVIFAVISLLSKIFKNKNQLSQFNDGNVEIVLNSKQIPASTSTNYTYSIWFYIEDWNYKYGQKKVILRRSYNNNRRNPCPEISLGAFQNDLNVAIQTYPNTDSPNSSSAIQIFNCSVKNVPIQSWVNAIVSVSGRTLDIYLDGKLVKTCVMPGVARVAGNVPLIITPNAGFSGFTSNIQYWPNASNPQDAWNIYKKGNGEGSLNVFNKYKLKLALLENNKERLFYKTP